MSANLAVCAEMVLTHLPVVDRVAQLHAWGFAVEIWDWSDKDLDALAATGATFTSMTGYLDGELVDPAGADRLLATAEESIAAARVLGRPNLNLHGTGLGPQGLPVRPHHGPVTGSMWLAAGRTLERLAALGERHDVVFTLENLNLAVDHPGTPFASAADCLALVAHVGSPHLRMNLDLYHAQIGEGNLADLLRRSITHIGEIQVADVPGRCEPGTGEIGYPFLATVLADLGYAGTIGLEAWASGDDAVAVQRFRDAFAATR
ncbi:TIM barrel protein [Kineococcus gynurae]|uniref:TIM barrel protein n=1 Tax=Kineococcus gynurae TaxID=452979 RepID=A0ABV5LW01_9ACTN